MSRTTDACDSHVEKDDPWRSHRLSTLKGTAEVLQSLELDRVVDVAVWGYRDRPQTIRCPDEPKVVFREMADEHPDGDLGDDEQSEETSDAEVPNGDADDAKDKVAHDTQMRHSPSSFPENAHVCVDTDVNRHKEKGDGGDAAEVNSASSYSSDTPSIRT